MANFSFTDNTIILLYLLLFIVVGLFAATKKEENREDYFLAGRKLGWLAIGSSLIVTHVSGETIIGLMLFSSQIGFSALNIELISVVAILLLGWIFAPIYLKNTIHTVPEYLEKRFNKSSRLAFSFISVIFYLAVRIFLTVLVGTILLQWFLGTGQFSTTFLLVFLTGLFTVIGGIYAVVYTGILQLVFIFGGIFSLFLYLIFQIQDSALISGALFNVNIFNQNTQNLLPWSGILLGVPVIWIWYWCTDQFIVHRILTTKNLRTAHQATLFAAILKAVLSFLIISAGLLFFYTSQPGSSALSSKIILLIQNLPVFVKGIVITALLAAIMSSLASAFNSTASLLVNDFYSLFHKGNENNNLLAGRLITIALIFLSFFIIPFANNFSLENYILIFSIQAFLTPPITAIFLMGIFRKKTSSKAAISAMLLGGFLGLFRLMLDLLNEFVTINNSFLISVLNINFLHFSALLFAFSIIVMLTTDYLYKTVESEENENLVYHFSTLKQTLFHFKTKPKSINLRRSL